MLVLHLIQNKYSFSPEMNNPHVKWKDLRRRKKKKKMWRSWWWTIHVQWAASGMWTIHTGLQSPLSVFYLLIRSTQKICTCIKIKNKFRSWLKNASLYNTHLLCYLQLRMKKSNGTYSRFGLICIETLSEHQLCPN